MALWEPYLLLPLSPRISDMEQKVRVKEIYADGTALVVHTRLSACSGDCHKCSGCGAARETMVLKAENPIGAQPGSLVKIQSESAPVLKAAAILYVLPLLLFFLGYGLGAAAGISGGGLGGAGFFLGIFLVVLYDRHLQKNNQTVYTITELVEAPSKKP